MQRELEIENLQRDIEGLTSTLQDTQADEHRLWNILQEDESNAQNRHSVERRLQENEEHHERIRAPAFPAKAADLR